MTGLLVSVRSAAEAEAAIQGGADLVDVKEPHHGSLGAADPSTWDAVRNIAGTRLPLSAALGELLVDDIAQSAPDLRGFRFAKIGLAGCADYADWPSRWQTAWESLPSGVASVAVVYADAQAARAPAPHEIIRCGLDLGCQAILVDTYRKTSGGLFDQISSGQLARLVEAARRHGWMVVLGGSLDAQTMVTACELSPDYVAVRGAACRAGRTGELDSRRVRRLAEQIASLARPDCHGHRQVPPVVRSS